jgi:hypothetical protein
MIDLPVSCIVCCGVEYKAKAKHVGCMKSLLSIQFDGDNK